MRAVGTKNPGPLSVPDALADITLPRPVPQGRDLLVEVKAVSVNPVDTKVRQRQAVGEDWKVLGWDAAGVVVETGPEVSGFHVGDTVYYAGDLTRPGTNAEFHRVDERLAARKPASLSFAEAAALPLTALTAWETLFDRLDVARPVPGAARSLLIIGGAGGVGSIAIQLARALTDLTVIATASRPETRDWVTTLGAHHVVDHTRPLAQALADQGLASPGLVFSTTQTDQHWAEIVALIAPQGRFALIDDPAQLDVMPLKRKSVSVHWEFMFTRSLFQTADQEAQGRILAEVARLVDAGTLRTTLTEVLGPINAPTVRQAHALIESGKARGKIVLEGFA
ncbi:zinc-binding alcohol dehydrogenase family protein [Pararhodospirillum photometricum]|uniref:Zinc-type alcohol dehydrogenase-like protein n=1 Tax=Pararhodospirillum photometricum DSM 122 TaxID=1150469 RepID=H6SS03_PARPM|nr:zinc-binding alcohol dehydrogenase family protein [Pararhodospirillum photometricum]CCG07682.1 Zinc-containing alcohol dehydrogenase superfamily [Pararhodospirillum photometricum DSM 122]